MNKQDVVDMLSRKHATKAEIERVVRPEDIPEIADIVMDEVSTYLEAGDRASADAILRRAVHAQVSAIDLFEAAMRFNAQ